MHTAAGPSEKIIHSQLKKNIEMCAFRFQNNGFGLEETGLPESLCTVLLKVAWHEIGLSAGLYAHVVKAHSR
jgi:hypothetical protein